MVLGIAAGKANAAQLTLTWTDNDNGTAAFDVERMTGTAGTYAQIATTTMGATTYVDTTIAAGTTYCYRVRAANTSGVSAYSNQACAAAASSFDVTVAKAGTGAGTVVSSPTGINCGTACFYSFPGGTVVTLAATPASGSVFDGWSGGGCTGTAPCVISGNTPVTITASFSPAPTTASDTLGVTLSGTGTGSVVSSPAGIACGSACTETVTAGTTVTLTATPATGSTFGGWSGSGCSGTGTCTVTVNANTSVAATFTTTTTGMYRLTVTKAGTGSGTVVSSPAGINCGTDCVEDYAKGTTVRLTATAATGSTFTGWTGDSDCTDGKVRMRSNRNCTANFTAVSSGGSTAPTPTTYNCPCTIWPATATPGIADDPDTQAVELGVKFRADADGYVTGIRFYKGTANTGTHVGNLWTTSGQLLATVTFAGETASGWQQANFSAPVPVTANTTYIASYHTSVGRYADDPTYFATQGVDAAPLHALSTTAGAGDGVYAYGASSAFPNQTYNADNYWVDVAFQPR